MSARRTSRSGARRAASDVFNNPVLIGTVTILVGLVAVYLSYIAENGLPFVPSYNISVDVASAGQLVKNADVRVGGARVGQVLKITPEPTGTDPGYPHPFARLQLTLDKDIAPLPYNTRYEVRLQSVLGGMYLELFPGNDRNTHSTPALPNGATFRLGTQPSHNIPFVDVNTAFDAFGPKTQTGVRNAVSELGDALAGRGAQFNDAIYELHRLIGPLRDILQILAAPSTHLGEFLSGAAATTSALAPVASTFTALLADGASTFAALDVPALGATIDQLPSTESLGTTVLRRAQPVLAGIANLVQELRPGVSLLPLAGYRLSALLSAATPVFKRAPQLASTLQTALGAVGALVRDPATRETFELLGANDLATVGSSAFLGLGAILHAVGPAQLSCNVAGIWIRNIASIASEGDAAGGWLRFSGVVDPTLRLELLANKPSADLHEDIYPIENSSECQAGNETYAPGQVIGNPGPTSATVDNTAPPAGALARGQAAGLVP